MEDQSWVFRGMFRTQATAFCDHRNPEWVERQSTRKLDLGRPERPLSDDDLRAAFDP